MEVFKKCWYAWDVPRVVFDKFSERYSKKSVVSRDIFEENRKERWLVKELNPRVAGCDGIICLRIILNESGQPRKALFNIWDKNITDYELAVECDEEKEFFLESLIQIEGRVNGNNLGEIVMSNFQDPMEVGPHSRLVLRAMFFANRAYGNDRFRSFVIQDLIDF